MTLLWQGWTRIYFNSRTEGRLFWSVDRGDISTEVKCESVFITMAMRSVVVERAPLGEPRAWFEGEAHVWRDGGRIEVAHDLA